jgi:hypothetical protein
MPEKVLNLAEGPVVVSWPDRLSPASRRELESWVAQLLGDIERQAPPPSGALKHDDYEGGE